MRRRVPTAYQGTRTALESITSATAHRGLGNADFVELPGGAYRPWFYNTTRADDKFMHLKPLLFGPALSFADAGVLFGGHVVDYSHNLSFITVHGSVSRQWQHGVFVPHPPTEPAVAYEMYCRDTWCLNFDRRLLCTCCRLYS